ncbi:unnamed protein product [Prunus armeniaca]
MDKDRKKSYLFVNVAATFGLNGDNSMQSHVTEGWFLGLKWWLPPLARQGEVSKASLTPDNDGVPKASLSPNDDGGAEGIARA